MHLLFSFIWMAASDPVVEVFLPHLPDRHLNQALGLARRVVDHAYSDIGVQVVWRLGKVPPAGCHKKPGVRQVVFSLREGKANNRNTLAFAQPHRTEGPCVTLFADRVAADAVRQPQTTALLLGHVLAHEIAHVLQGMERHSDSGLLKEHWSPQDIAQMVSAPLRFTEHDALLIHDPFREQPVHQEN